MRLPGWRNGSGSAPARPCSTSGRARASSRDRSFRSTQRSSRSSRATRDARRWSAFCQRSGCFCGTAESLPLPNAFVDAIAVGQALHWFEPRSAQAEMHCVLRPGGAFAALFNTWDSGDPLLAELRKLVDALRSDRGAGADRLDHHDRRLFGEPEERSFGQTRYLTADAIADWWRRRARSRAPTARRLHVQTLTCEHSSQARAPT